MRCRVIFVVASVLALGACGDDDGGQNNNNAQPVCGNALIELGEICDSFSLGGEDCTNHGFASGTLACNGTCTGFDTSACIPDQANCGNNTIDVPETCDGNNLNSQDCTTVGNFTGGTLACNSTCSGWDTTGCTNNPNTCGNNTQEGSETCDGSDLNGASCTTVAGGFTGGTLTCNSTCTGYITTGCTNDPVCGNDLVETGELCDGIDLDSEDCTTVAGNFTAGALGCNATCDGWDTSSCWTMPADCGNGAIDGSEACDGDNLNGTSCTTLGYAGGSLLCKGDCSGFIRFGCTNSEATCGNDLAEPTEQCDDTDLRGLDCTDFDMDGGTLGCNADCSYDLSSCTGDMCANQGWYSDGWCDPCEAYGGTLDPDCLTVCFTTGDGCDDWDDPIVGGSSCNHALGVTDPDCFVCGDGTLDSEFEQCDSSETGTLTCEDLGFAAGGTLGCDNHCVLQTTGCSAATCGDTTVEGWEECEGSSIGTETCATLGFTDGTLSCDSGSCQFNTSQCYLCNNGIVENGEACDGADVGTDTCGAHGFANGTLTCNNTCDDVDTSVCYDDYTVNASATYSWVDISATGTATVMDDDVYEGPVAIGFTFPFYGHDQTELYMSSNSLVTFGGGLTSYSNSCPMPSSSLTRPAIAVMWDDLDPDTFGDSMYYQSFSGAACPVSNNSCFVVTWSGYHHFSDDTNAGTFQAILFENGSVLLQYQDVGVEAGLESTSGMQWNQSVSHSHACNTATLTALSAVCFEAAGTSGCN